jgi:glycosyltransferase involved in cell wall biosynthesis
VKIAFVVERPTQFEVPFYRYTAAGNAHHLRVIYTDPRLDAPVFDPELGRAVDWGFDLLGGYDHAVCPSRERRRWLTREMRRESYDLVIINGYTQKTYLLAALQARRAGIPAALRLDSVLFETPPPRARAKRLLFDVFLTRAFRLFFGTGSLTLDYLRYFGVPAERTALFPYAIDVESFRRGAALALPQRAEVRARLGLPAEARVLLSLAKLHPREAPWDLLRAFARSQDPNTWLALAGDGPSRTELETFAREHGLRRVAFLGYVPYPQLPALYAAADLFIHPAREERWGVSVAEAMACGLPVITSSRVGAARDLLVAGENGFTYQAGDEEELSRRIDEALRLSPAAVSERNRALLAGWDYAATWNHLIEAANR